MCGSGCEQACHELALAVTYFGVRSGDCTVDIDRAGCEMLKLGGQEDFSKLAFTLRSSAGRAVAIRATRCGGDFSVARVTTGGGSVTEFRMPSAEEEERVAAAQKADPEIMGYFLTQWDS